METVTGPDRIEERLALMIDQYQLPLLRLCFAYLHEEEAAKDAVQETFLKAYRHLPDFKAGSSEQTWLYRIAINVCKDMRRSTWFRHVDRRVSLDMLPEAVVEPRTDENALTLEIMKLPPKLREAALLCWMQGMTYDAAAKVLGVTAQAVGSRLARARKKLRCYLEGREQNDAVR